MTEYLLKFDRRGQDELPQFTKLYKTFVLLRTHGRCDKTVTPNFVRRTNVSSCTHTDTRIGNKNYRESQKKSTLELAYQGCCRCRQTISEKEHFF